MSGVAKRTFSLSQEQAEFIDTKVASGDYASGSEVIREGLRILKARELARGIEIERWLREEVVPTALEMQAHPETGIPVAEAFAWIRDEIHRRRADAS